MKENERLKSDKSRKGYLYGQGASGATGPSTGASYAGKFNSTLFGQHLLKNTAQKENTGGVASSQVFTSGFSKFIGDGMAREDKVDPTSLPLAVNTQNHVRGLGSPAQPTSFTGLHGKTGSIGTASFKSGSNLGKNEFGGASHSDETNSQN